MGPTENERLLMQNNNNN